MSKLLVPDTNKDAIMAYLINPEDDNVKLTRKQQDLLDWYVDAYTIVRNYNSIPDAIQVLKKLGDRRGTPISASTARRYINDGLEMFGQVNLLKPNVIKHLVVETLLDARNMAKSQNNPAAMIQAAEKLHKIGGEEDANSLYAEDIERHTVVINIDQKAKRALDMIYKTGVVDFGDMLNAQAEDASFEEVEHDSE